jgi:hypothetical protein
MPNHFRTVLCLLAALQGASLAQAQSPLSQRLLRAPNVRMETVQIDANTGVIQRRTSPLDLQFLGFTIRTQAYCFGTRPAGRTNFSNLLTYQVGSQD